MGLYKRHRVWWMSVMYQGRQVRRSTGTTDRRLAEAILAKVRVQIVEGQFFDTREEQHRTFDELMARYLAEHAARKSQPRHYRGHAKRLTAFFGGYTLAEITPKLIVDYKNQRYAAGLKPASINRELATLKKAFNLAVREWEWCRENPVSRVSMEREHNQRDRWLSREEETRLLHACAPWLHGLVMFALHTGMRMGEIVALTWRGVDLHRRTVTVFRSKNGERRTIPVNDTVLAVLNEKSTVRSLKTDLVFCSQAFTPLESGHLRRSFRLALRKAEIGDFHFHDLRHTFATRLVQAGVDLYKVQRLLGHQSPLMTQRYAHHYPESLRDGVEILDRMAGVSTKVAQSAGSPT
ncbi:MAG TPA: tyrosine-type recombinase/integrase, partial [Nitrospiraceae bacterium]|nr:tyrosine-type recombinase/integrase [Nitrospiraceae bacterium]